MSNLHCNEFPATSPRRTRTCREVSCHGYCLSDCEWDSETSATGARHQAVTCRCKLGDNTTSNQSHDMTSIMPRWYNYRSRPRGMGCWERCPLRIGYCPSPEKNLMFFSDAIWCMFQCLQKCCTPTHRKGDTFTLVSPLPLDMTHQPITEELIGFTSLVTLIYASTSTWSHGIISRVDVHSWMQNAILL